MQRNSNQQTFNVSIRSKRERFRAQIRRQQLQAYFQAKRIQYFSNPKPKDNIDYYKELQQRIKLCPTDSESLQDIETEVRNLFEKNPQEEMNFYALGHLILKLPDKFLDFKNFIIHQENLVFHSTGFFAWCFGMYFGFLFCEIDANNLQQNFISDIEQIDMFLAALIDKFFNNKNFPINQDTLYCFETYVECFKSILILMEKQAFFPIFLFNSVIVKLQDFYKKIADQKVIYVRDLKIKIAEMVNAITNNIDLKKLYVSEKPQFDSLVPADINPDYIITTTRMEQFMKSAAEIFYENIKDASEERNQCYKSVLILAKWSAINAGDFLFTQKNIKQFIFHMINQKPQVSMTIAKSFTFVLPGLSNKKMEGMFKQSLHINLVILLRNSLNEVHSSKEQEGRYSDSLFHVLRLIELLLDKTEEMDNFIYRKIFTQMENNGFGDLMQSMNAHRYEKRIEDVWANILDNHFSEEMEDENKYQNQNSGDYMNVGFHGNNQQMHEYKYNSTNNYQKEYEI